MARVIGEPAAADLIDDLNWGSPSSVTLRSSSCNSASGLVPRNLIPTGTVTGRAAPFFAFFDDESPCGVRDLPMELEVQSLPITNPNSTAVNRTVFLLFIILLSGFASQKSN